jgi:hypothetical protein
MLSAALCGRPFSPVKEISCSQLSTPRAKGQQRSVNMMYASSTICAMAACRLPPAWAGKKTGMNAMANLRSISVVSQ